MNRKGEGKMSRLSDVLVRYTPNRIGAGDNFDAEGLKQALTVVLSDLRRVYAAVAVMIAVVFVVEVVIAVMYVHEPKVLIGIAGAVGLTIAGGIDRMSRLAREMAQTNL